MTRKRNKVRAGNNNSSRTQQAKNIAPKPHPPTPSKPPKPRALPARTISLHNVPHTISIANISALIPTIPIIEHKRSVDPVTSEHSSIVFLLFGTKEDAVRAYFGLDGSALGSEIVRANWVNGVRFESVAKKAEKDGEQAGAGEVDSKVEETGHDELDKAESGVRRGS